jgi:DNA-binding transcriptional LysR family regulator
VVVDTLFPRSWLVRALAEFAGAFPRVTVNVREALLNEAVQAVLRGDADYGLCNLVDADTAMLVARPLIEIDLIPVCASGHALAEAEAPQPMSILQSCTQIVITEREPNATSADQGVLSARTWRVASLQTKLELLLAGVGWGSLPWPMVREHLAKGRLVQLVPEPWPKGHRISMQGVQRADQPVGPAGRGFIEAVEATRPHPGYALARVS